MKPTLLILALVALLGGPKGCSIEWPQPNPTPTPTAGPTDPPTPIPPTPAPTPAPTPTPTPTPSSYCPKRLAEGAEVYLNAKPYGNGFDSTVRVRGDVEFCQIIHGVTTNDCHLEGWGYRVRCEMELLGGCPIWQFRDAAGVIRCADTGEDLPAGCHHWGTAGGAHDDPKTPEYEGEPRECASQTLGGRPAAGFWCVVSGKGEVRACKPDGTGCSPWRPVDH